MDTPLRRSRRLEGLMPEAMENLASAGRARRALVRFESGPEEVRGPGSPVSVPQPGPGSPPSPPGLPRGADAGCPRGERGPGLESPPRQPEARPGAPQSAESPGSPPPQLQSGPGSPGSSQAPAAGTVTGGLGAKKRHGPSDQAPAAKKLKREREEALPVVPKGKPKSGRVWKDRSKKRFSQMVQDKPLRTSWQRKMQERQQRRLARDLARHLEAEKARRRQEKKQRRAENLRRRLENERRAEVVQVIRNPAKLKRAKKKQLRSVQKRDTLALLQRPQPCRPGPRPEQEDAGRRLCQKERGPGSGLSGSGTESPTPGPRPGSLSPRAVT